MQMQLRMDVTGKHISNEITRAHISRVLSTLLFIYCAVMPFEEALAFGFGSILRLIGLVIIVYAVFFLARMKIRVRNIRLLIPFGIWLAWSFFSILWSDSFDWWKYFFGIYFFQFIFVFAVAACADRIDIHYVLHGIITGALLASTLLILFPRNSTFTRDGRRTIILFSREFDPNIVASIIMLGFFACTVYIFGHTRRKRRYGLLAAILFVGMLFTGSRGALISFVLAFGFELLLEMKRADTRRAAGWMIVAAAVVAIYASRYLPENLLESRFSIENILGITEYKRGAHNRYTIWKHGIDLFAQSPIIGYGCGNFFSAIATVYRECASHNLYLLLAVEGGVIGVAFFINGVLKLLNLLRKQRNYAVLAMFLSACVMAMTLDTITYKYFWVCIIVCLVSVLHGWNGASNVEEV